MNTKTYSRWVGFVLVLGLSSPIVRSKAPPESAQVTISVYNDAGVPGAVLLRGEDVAGRVFEQAGIEVKWLNCQVPAAIEEESKLCREAVFPQHLQMRIARKARTLNGDAMGISFLATDGSGCYADVFYEPMEQVHKSSGADIASLLGHVVAHEVGHLLLGRNSHAASGIMQARWTAEELASNEMGKVAFTEKESRQMKETLLTRREFSKKISLVAGARTGD
jgi:hypothetical protein